MDTDPTFSPRGDTNIANVGAGALVEQIAQGSNITQIKGYTAEQVRVLIADIRASYQPKPFDGRSPYVGLASFQEQDADRFFGREKLTKELVARIETARFLVIAGPSGSGKSSLARAGLFHALKKGALAGSENWLYEILTPGRHPLEQLARVVSSFAKSTNAGDEIQQRGRDDATLLHRWADIALGDQRARRAILLVDQFEESFTQADENERAAFFNLLLYAATIENGRVTIVCCTRSDFIGNWTAYPNLNAQLSHGVNQIPPMQPDELVSAIARPALQVGLQIDPELVKQILDDMRDAPGALPLMQFALDDLFEYKKSKGGMIALTRDDYLERGGLQKALARHADAEFAKLSADEQQIARTVFAGLIEPGRGTADTKRTALFQELVPSSADATRVRDVVDKLATARLVTTDDKTVTLAHERLIDAWGWLRKLVDENREAIALQNQIAEDAQEWEQHGRDASYLYTGARLATAQEQVAEKKIKLSALAKEFVDASIDAREEQKRKETQRTRRLIMAFGAAAAVFGLLAILAFLLRQQAVLSEARAQAESTRAVQGEQNAAAAVETAVANRNLAETRQAEAIAQKNEAEHQQKIARSRELAALALAQFDVNPNAAVLIAIEANRDPSAVTYESEDTLRQLLVKYPLHLILRGHNDVVKSAQFSLDGSKILTASNDWTARVWDASSGKELFSLRGHQEWVNYAEFSMDGRMIITAGGDNTVRVWDVASQKQIRVLRGHEKGIFSARFSPDGTKIVTAGCEEDVFITNFVCVRATVRVWDTGSGMQLLILRGQDSAIYSAQFSPDSTKIVTAGCEASEFNVCRAGSVRVWDATSGKELVAMKGHDDVVPSAQFAPDGARIVTASFDKTARVWRVSTGEELLVLRGHENSVYSASFSPDGRMIVTASHDRTARVWDADSGKALAVLRGHEDAVAKASFSPDGTKIVTASVDATARVWDVAPGKEFGLLRSLSSTHRAQFSPDGTKIVTANADKTARVWDIRSGEQLTILNGHQGEVVSADFSADGSKIVTASADRTARVWDAASGKELAILEGHKGIVWSAQFSPDGSKIVTAGCEKLENKICSLRAGAGTARVWDASSGKEITVLPLADGWHRSAQFSPDGTKIVTAGCQINNNGFCILGAVNVWDTESGEQIAHLSGLDMLVQSASYSPDGRKIVIGSADKTARVLDSASLEEVAVLRGHQDWVNFAQFSLDGQRLVTASSDMTAQVWDADSWKQLAVLRGHESLVASAGFSPDGSKIVTASADGTARIYLVNVKDLVELAKKRIGRGLTCEERVQHLHEQIVCPTPTPQN